MVIKYTSIIYIYIYYVTWKGRKKCYKSFSLDMVKKEDQRNFSAEVTLTKI